MALNAIALSSSEKKPSDDSRKVGLQAGLSHFSHDYRINKNGLLNAEMEFRDAANPTCTPLQTLCSRCASESIARLLASVLQKPFDKHSDLLLHEHQHDDLCSAQ